MDIQKFMAAEISHRTEIVEVPELKHFFTEGEKPVIKVRGLSGHEYGKMQDYIQNNSKIGDIVGALKSGNYLDAATQILKDSLDPDKTAEDVVRRIAILKYGIVDKWDESAIVRLATYYGLIFYKLSNKILELTSMMAEVGGLKPCGETKESGQPLHSMPSIVSTQAI